MSAIRSIDPRRSLAAGAMWLIIALALAFSTAAAVWVGRIARENVLEQHVRRLALETDQLGLDVGQALATRLDAVRAARKILKDTADRPRGLSGLFEELVSAYPELDWIAAADADGLIVDAATLYEKNAAVGTETWFVGGMQGPWIGTLGHGAAARDPGSAAAVDAGLGDMAVPVLDDSGRVLGVVAARLHWRRSSPIPLRLTDEIGAEVTQASVLDARGRVLVGPESGTVAVAADAGAAAPPYFGRLRDGRQVLICRAPLAVGGELSRLGWQVQLTEPKDRVFQRADALTWQILWVSLGLGAATALLGIAGARQLTRRLERLAGSVAAVGRNESVRIEVPAGRDEVTQLAAAFDQLLDDLQTERRELQTLGAELEHRVAVRTGEVQRLAEESRYAAVVRERLKIARDLHDTLAHSMMAMLSEIRFMRKLLLHDPAAVAAELAHAEEVARDGLKEARTAITQMRFNAVRDTGLGPALSREVERFVDHTGVAGDFAADADAARFGDERAETLLRIAQEALRNAERHARATRVCVTLAAVGTHLELRVEDNGVGFDTRSLSPGHFGIVGLREQAEIIGADLRIDSGQGGTRVSVSLPLSPIDFDRSA